MNELIREIEDDIRRERFEKLWHDFGKVMIGISAVVILATVVIVLMQNHRQSRAMEQTAIYIKGTDRINIEDYKGAIPIFDELARDAHSPYYGPAMLRKAQSQNALGDSAGAAKTYAELAKSGGAFSELAKMLTPDLANEPVKSSPFYYSQSEAKGWLLLGAGKKDEAVAQFASVAKDSETPYSMRERLNEVLQHIAPDALKKEVAHD
jgi:hypothetical protein